MSSPVFTVTTAEDNVTPLQYSCERLMGDNEVYFLRAEYYYDIKYDLGEDLSSVVAKGEAALLNSVATEFGLIDGARCSIPSLTTLWLIQVASASTDELVPEFASCQELVPVEGQSCAVYRGFMEAYYLEGAGNPDDFEKYIQQNLNSVAGANGSFELRYLGAELDTSQLGSNTAKDNLNAAASQAEPSQPQPEDKKTFTFVGGILVAAFLAAFLGFIFMLYRRRQSFLAAQEMEIALSKSDLDDATPRDNSMVPPESLEPEIGEESVEDEFPGGGYRFDLATSMKNELFNIHGRAGDPQKMYGIGIEETSDSDADSWAQTDGTIGSLELQLEPITAEV